MNIGSLTAAMLLVSAAAGPAQARTPVPIIDPAPVAFMSGAAPDAAAFKAVVVKAGTANGWVLQSESGDVYTMSLVVRSKHTVTVDVKFTDKGYSMAYVGSVNMNYALKDGTPVIHPYYNRWVETLNRAIQLELSHSSK